MSMPVEPATTDPADNQDPAATEGTVTEPAPTPPMYADILEKLPDSVRPLVEPSFKDWDTKVQERFNAVRKEEADKYESWKPITDSWDPEVVSEAMKLAQFMQQDPAGLTKALAEQLGLTVSEAKAVIKEATDPATGEPNEPDPIDQRLQTLERQNQQLIEFLASGQQQQELTSAMTQLEKAHEVMHTKHGAYDESWVNVLVSQDVPIEKAVEQYKAAIGTAVTTATAPNATAPPVMGGTGGGAPAEKVDLGKLSEKERKALVMDIAQRAANENT